MKGQGKALEIVLILLVLVIVVYVVLDIFTKYMAQESEKLQGIQSQQEQRMAAQKIVQQCQVKCSNYKRSMSNKDLVEFCVSFNEIDLNGDGDKNDYSDTSVFAEVSLGGVGSCEAMVPCFLLVECPNVDAKKCSEAICSYYSNLGVAGSALDARLNELLDPGSCHDKFLAYHWFTIAFPQTKRGELECIQ